MPTDHPQPTSFPIPIPIPIPFPADVHILDGLDGKIVIYSGGPGQSGNTQGAELGMSGSFSPVLIVHTVNAAACAAEIRPLFTHYQKSRPVYALDLPGYGLSERRPIRYTIKIMTDAIKLATQWIQARHPGEAIWAIGTSLSCEFIARCATEEPTIYSHIALISPTGFRGLRELRGAAGSSRYMATVDKIVRGPLWDTGDVAGWGGFLFRALTRPKVIRYFLERTWGSKDIDEELWAYDVLTTRAKNAEYAPLSFLSAALFSADISAVYERIEIPVFVIHGTLGDFTDYRGLKLIKDKPNWQVQVMPGGALPYFERPVDFFGYLDAWLERIK